MRTFRRKTLAVLGAALVLLVFLNRYVLHDKLSDMVSRAQAPLASRLFEKFNALGTLTQTLQRYRTLAQENDALKQEHGQFVQMDALVRDLKEENAFLKRSLGLQERVERAVVPANVFSSMRTPLGHTLFLNRGSANGVAAGDVVATSSGILVGEVNAVSEHSATIRLVTDPGFEVTVKIPGTETTGLARGTSGDKLSLDLIVQADKVQEGDTVVTSGDDRFPPSLVVGSVEHVQSSETQLFKDVRVVPALGVLRFGRVLLIPAK